MRGRRHKLQVSTFPFLAVLLCAMGSLILILLVMDRKAHRAALARAQQRATKLAQETARNDAERIRMREQARAEHEQKREEIHTKLSNEQIEMQLQMRNIRNQLQEIAARLHYEQDTSTELRRKVQEKRGQLQADERLLLALRTTAQQTENRAQESNQTLHRMTVDLLRMEQALKDLKASQKREQKTFSVVPYHGRRGENRRPIYVECFAEGIVFHPEHKAMSLRSMLPGARDPSGDARAEVERRIAIQRAKLAKLPGNEEQTPYLLLLVRPAGVHTYYYFQAALRGLELQFGYEFIDDDWVLDFPADDEMPSAQPWMIATKTPARSTPAPAVPPLVKANPQPTGRVPNGAPLSGFTGTNGGIPKQEPPRMSFSPSAGGTGTGTGSNGSSAPAGAAFSGSASGSTGQDAPLFPKRSFPNLLSGGRQPPELSASQGADAPRSGFETVSNSAGGTRRSSAMPHPFLADASGPTGDSGLPATGGGGSFRGLGRVIPGGGGSGSGFGPPGLGDGSSGGGGYDGPNGGGGGGSVLGSGTGGSGMGGGSGLSGAASGGTYAQGGAPLGGTGYGNGGNGTGASGNGGSGGGIGGTGYGNAGNGTLGVGYGNSGSGTGAPGNGTSANGNGTGTLANGTSGGGNGTGAPGNGASGNGTANSGMASSGSLSGGASNDGRTVIASAGSDGNGASSVSPTSGGVANGAASGGVGAATSGQAGGSAEFGDNLPAQENSGTPSNGGRSTDRVIYLDPATGRPIKPPPSAPPTDEQPSAEQAPPQEAAGNRGPPRVHVVVGNGGQGGKPADPQSQAMNRFAPTPSVAPPRRRPVVTKPGWVHGGRDWTIYLECREEGVVLYPLERMFSLAEATREPSSNTLIKTIQQMIDRRQSARRPDEPPYHPSLCLLVRPEHIRTYLSVSSALQALPTPKTRRNLDDDDDLIGIVTGSVP